MRIVSDDDYDDDEITLSDCDPDEPSEFSHPRDCSCDGCDSPHW